MQYFSTNSCFYAIFHWRHLSLLYWKGRKKEGTYLLRLKEVKKIVSINLFVNISSILAWIYFSIVSQSLSLIEVTHTHGVKFDGAAALSWKETLIHILLKVYFLLLTILTIFWAWYSSISVSNADTASLQVTVSVIGRVSKRRSNKGPIVAILILLTQVLTHWSILSSELMLFIQISALFFVVSLCMMVKNHEALYIGTYLVIYIVQETCIYKRQK